MWSALKALRRILWVLWIIWMALRLGALASPQVALFFLGLRLGNTTVEALTVVLPLVAIVVGILELITRKRHQKVKQAALSTPQ